MRVLLVSYHFPPDAEVGGVRPLQIARYLPQFGIEPWVLTVEPRFAESPNPGLLPKGVPEDRILRTPVNETMYHRMARLWRGAKRFRARRGGGTAAVQVRPVGPGSLGGWAGHLLAFPDDKFGWYRPALRAADDAVRRVGFDAIISTSPPRVAALIAGTLSRRHRLPWIMDIRDPWWGWYQRPTSRADQSAGIAFLQEQLFRRCVAGASLVVHNTERLRRLTCQIVADAGPKTRCIPNGCDPEWRAPRADAPSPTFRIGYYGQIMGWRSPAAFLHGFRLWLDSAQPDHSRISIRFVGSGFEEVARQAQDLGLSHLVELAPSVPRQDVPAHMAADFVLLLVANAQPLQIPGKAYEYLAAGRRILALTDHDGATADLLQPQEGCIVAERADEVRAALERFFHEYQAGAGAWIDRSALLAEMQYPRRVERFADLLREIVRPDGQQPAASSSLR